MSITNNSARRRLLKEADKEKEFQIKAIETNIYSAVDPAALT